MPAFYYSWTKQNVAVDFPVRSTEHDEFILEDGRRVYDFISTSFQANFGHSHRLIKERIAAQLELMPMASPKSTFDLKSSVSDRLNSLIGLGEGKIFFTVSGSESVENALKIARQFTGRKIVLARKKSYHGASLGALSVTGDWRNDPHVTFDEGTVRIPDHDVDPDLRNTKTIVRETGPENIAAIILETISGTNGMSVPSTEWFLEIQDLCRNHGILLIIDEVLVGFRRCGRDFAFHAYDLTPDIVCMSKAITGGYIPFGAVWTSAEIANYYQTEVLSCGLTNYGHPLGLAALDAVLATLESQDFSQEMLTLESEFRNELHRLESHSNVKEIRIRGLLAAIYLDRTAPSWQEGLDAGLHIFSQDNFSILAPPYVSSVERLQRAIQTFGNLLG